MKPSVIQKIFYYAGSALGTVGFLLLIGCVIAFLIGVETLLNFYAGNKPLIFFALAGVVMLLLGIVVSSVAGVTSIATTEVRPTPGGVIRCGNCEANNDFQAKFRDQCGMVLIGR